MLRLFHGWIAPTLVTKSTAGLVLSPAAEGGQCLVIQNKKTMTDRQYLVVEYRRRQFQDAFLPDGKWAGVTLKVKGRPGDATMVVDVVFGT